MSIVLDANIFLNVIFEEKLFFESSKKLLKHIESKKFQASISSITLAEILWVVYKESGYKIAREVQSYMRDLSELQVVKVVPLNEKIVYGMLSLVERYNLSLVDALVVSTAVVNKSKLVTRDEKIRKVRDIEVKTPGELI